MQTQKETIHQIYQKQETLVLKMEKEIKKK
jgi:hypothetical protein